jgi:Hemerythrin HHE cation binding domain
VPYRLIRSLRLANVARDSAIAPHMDEDTRMAATKKPNGAKAQAIDAVALLKADHRKVEALFETYETSRSKPAKAKLAQQICMELTVHATVEEEIFYPAVKGEVEDDMLDEAYVEHDGAKVLIGELLAGSPDDPFYDAKVKVLSEEIKHHVKEEEQRDGMFAQAKKAGVDMMELGARLAARKAELTKTYKASGIPTPQTRSMRGVQLDVGYPVEAAV